MEGNIITYDANPSTRHRRLHFGAVHIRQILAGFQSNHRKRSRFCRSTGDWGIIGSGFLQATGYQYYEDLTAASTTTTSFTNAATFTTSGPLVLGGRYRIAVFFSWTNGVSNSDSRFRLTVNGTQVGPEVRVEKVEVANQSIWENGFAVAPGTGAVAAIALQFASENNGVTTTVNEARFEIWRVS